MQQEHGGRVTSRWLETQLRGQGDQPDLRFALPATVNWVRALAIQTEAGGFSASQLSDSFSSVKRRIAANTKADILACEALFFSAHHNAALGAMRDQVDATAASSVARAAIISWYYALYTSARAMVLATSGHNPDKHATLIRVWHDDVAKRGLARGPYGLRLDTLVKRDTTGAVAELRATATGSLQTYPSNFSDAQGAIVEYLNGTAEYERWKCAAKTRKEPGFKALGVKDFKTKAAKDLLANAYARGAVNFMTQAYRFRGKANYRDSLFLSYGSSPTVDAPQFLQDLSFTAAAFARMAATLVSRRLPSLTWKAFIQDVELNARMPIDGPSLGLIA